MTAKHWMVSLLTAGLLIGATALITLIASGYHFNFQDKKLEGTGIILASSSPQGALLYINGVTYGATNTSANNIKPGQYEVRLDKQGYAPWVKTVEVQKERVTAVEATLVPLFPELKPLTFTGVKDPILSPDGQKVLYIAQNNGEEGIWLIDLSPRPFDLTSNPVLLLKDQSDKPYSKAKITWSPDSNQFLITLESENVLYDLVSNQTQPLLDLDLLHKNWQATQDKQKAKLMEALKPQVQEKIKALPEPTWSPDNTKLLYKHKQDSLTQYLVLDLTPQLLGQIQLDSLPEEYETLAVGSEGFTQVGWFADSKHLIILEKESLESTTGTISIIEIQGTNRTKVFAGTIISDKVYPSPEGSKIILLTSFNQPVSLTNLYAIKLR